MPRGIGQRITGTNWDNMCHIRTSSSTSAASPFPIHTSISSSAAFYSPPTRRHHKWRRRAAQLTTDTFHPHTGSGQYWQTCPPDEAEAYESSLEPALMEGMRYLWDNAAETGTVRLPLFPFFPLPLPASTHHGIPPDQTISPSQLGLRFLQNLNANGSPIKETCGAGFHRNWADLELWSSRHPSHLRIFNGAM